MAGLTDGHLQHQAAAVVSDAAHDVKAARSPGDQQIIMPSVMVVGDSFFVGGGKARAPTPDTQCTQD